jgi:predicted RNA-binding Zn-ribbon protein involved in translation (DUF1610 family)
MICPKCGKYCSDSYERCPSCKHLFGSTVDQKPRCPTCGSEQLMRFSGGVKVAKIASFGVLGLGNVHKTFKCKNCGYKW